MADYRIPGVGSAATAACAAGLIGTVIAFVFAFVLAAALVPKARADAIPGAGA